MMQTTISKHVPRAAAIAAALALAVGPGAVTAALAQSGPEQTAKFTKTVEGTMKSIDATKAQLEKTVAGYNSIMDQTAKDTKDAYKGLGKDITDSEKKVAEAKLKVDEMNAEAERHFAAWKDEHRGDLRPGAATEERGAARRCPVALSEDRRRRQGHPADLRRADDRSQEPDDLPRQRLERGGDHEPQAGRGQVQRRGPRASSARSTA